MDLTVGHCETMIAYLIGGFIGRQESAVYLNNCSVIASISVPNDERIIFAAAVALRVNVKIGALMNSTFAAVKSVNKTVMYFVDKLTPITYIVNSFMECIPGSGINMSDTSCNKTDMHTLEFMN